jgi:hypothetical protein
LREICPRKKCTPKSGANIGAITGILLKVLLDVLYVFNGKPDIPVTTYLLKRTIEIWMHRKSACATLIFVNI